MTGCGTADGARAVDAEDFADLLVFAAGIEEPWLLERFVDRLPTPVRRRMVEDEMAGMTAAGGYEGPGRGSHRSGTSMGSRSPDRADAMVWAMTELMAPPRAEPRVRRL